MEVTFVNLPTKILTLEEIQLVVRDLEERRDHRVEHWAMNAWANLVIFRLSCCCGLRSIEIRNIRLNDVLLGGSRPAIRIRKEATKGNSKARMVPLWWDSRTRDDIAEWVTHRRATRPSDSLVMRADWTNRSNEIAKSELMPSRKLFKRWQSAIRILGEDRCSQLGIHCGRHTFCTQSLRAGRELVEVRDAAGHTTINMTNNYLHVINSDNVGDVFEFLDKED